MVNCNLYWPKWRGITKLVISKTIPLYNNIPNLSNFYKINIMMPQQHEINELLLIFYFDPKAKKICIRRYWKKSSVTKYYLYILLIILTSCMLFKYSKKTKKNGVTFLNEICHFDVANDRKKKKKIELCSLKWILVVM